MQLLHSTTGSRAFEALNLWTNGTQALADGYCTASLKTIDPQTNSGFPMLDTKPSLSHCGSIQFCAMSDLAVVHSVSFSFIFMELEGFWRPRDNRSLSP